MTANPSENKKTPASGGIKSKLTDAQKAMLASKSGGGAPAGWQSTGIGEQLAVAGKEPGVDEGVCLDAGEGDRIGVRPEIADAA